MSSSTGSRLYGFFLYLAFVWGIAYFNQDFIWFNGDSATALQQAILMGRGLLPNIDFLSGYPGLDLQLNALFVSWIDSSVIAQQVYMAVVASILGAIFFWFFREIKPWLITLMLLFIYAQGLYVNPAPNPGYPFAALFILALINTYHFLQNYRYRYAAGAGLFFAIAFLTKQYGVFGPVCFFIATSAFVEGRGYLKEKIWPLVLGVGSFSFIAFYARGLYATNPNYKDLTVNVILYIFPTLAALFLILFKPRLNVKKTLTFKKAVVANLVCGVTFLITSAIYLISLYGIDNVPAVLGQVFIEVPRVINFAFAATVFDISTTVAILLSLVLLTLPFLNFPQRSFLFQKRFYYFKAGLLCLCLYLIFQSASLHMTIFVALQYGLLLLAQKHLVPGPEGQTLFAITSGLAPFMALLIPWPNPAYHIPLLVFLMLMTLGLSVKPIPRFSAPKWLKLAPPVATTCVVFFLVWPYRLHRETIPRWKLGNIEFMSKDKNWKVAFDEAAAVDKNNGICTHNGCRFLIFSLPWKSEYAAVIEKPITPQH